MSEKHYLNVRSGYMAPITLHCSYGDRGEKVTFYLFEGDKILDLSDSVVSLHGTRRDGGHFGPFPCSVNRNAVTFYLQSSMTVSEGGGIAEFVISKNDVTIGTCNFGILVEKAVFPNGVSYDSDPSVYQDILSFVQESLAKSVAQINAEIIARSAGDVANSEAIAVERSRIDEYLASGTSATDSELVDIRVGHDGTSYTSAGTAVRTQITDLHAETEEISDAMPKKLTLTFENQQIDTTNTISGNSTRLLSNIFYPSNAGTISINDGYEFRIASIISDSSVAFNSWDTVSSITSTMIDMYPNGFRLNVRNANDTTANISSSEVEFDTNISNIFVYDGIARKQAETIAYELKKVMPYTTNLTFTNSRISSTNTIESDNTRLLSNIFYPSNAGTISVNDGYEFRIANIVSDSSVAFHSWDTTSQITDTMISMYPNGFRLNVRNANDGSATVPISSDDVQIMTDIDSIVDYVYVAKQSDLDALRNKVNNELNQFNLNRNLTGLTDMCWEYQNWVFPQVLSYNGIRDQLYFTFTNGSGYSGIAQYNYTTRELTKTFLKKNKYVDDHNLIAVLILPNTGKLLCVYSGGHNTDKHMYIRRSTVAESIESFDDVITIDSSGGTTYGQLFYYNNTVYLFYRVSNNSWAYRTSLDDGETWTQEQILITASMQYYIQLTETTTSGTLRLLCYSNPGSGDTNIRMGYLHLSNMTIYDVDNSTVISAAPIAYTQITTIIPEVGNGIVNRLFNAAKTPVGKTLVLFARFPIDGSTTATYYIYDSDQPNYIEIGDAGLAYWVPKCQLGIAWIGTNQIAVARGYNNSDILEIYDYSNGMISLNKQVTSRSRGSQNIRTGKPMIDNNQRSLLYLTGYYNPNVYTDFDMDGVIYSL